MRNKNGGINVLEFLVVFFVIAIVYYFYKKKKIQILKRYDEKLELANNEMKAFRHDFNNILQAIGGYIKMEDFDGLKKYFKDLEAECKFLKNIRDINNKVKSKR